MAEWRFPSNDHGEKKGINDSGVATFRGTPVKSLAREICQNSLDAAVKETVELEFNMFTLPMSDIPGIDVLKDTFYRCRDFWSIQKGSATKEFFTKAIRMVEKETCAVLRISDFNTTGLLGSHEEINTDWTNLTKSSGASDKKGTAGGSYGIGKYAPFACSDFATVFYSTYDIQKEEAYQGVSRLVTFRRNDNETTQGIGYFGNEYNTPVYEQLKLDPSFSRENDKYGTDIFVCGYKFADDDWQKGIVVSVLDGFLGAIWNNKLIVRVGETEISKTNLDNLIEEYREDLTGNTEKYYEVLNSSDTVWVKKDFLGLGDVNLGLLIGNPDAPKKISMIRKTGMKIMEKDRLSANVPFIGIMFLEGDKLNERLRLIENPEHTEWQPDRSANPANERVLLRELYALIREQISSLIMNSSKDEMDAVGAGTFIPDDMEENDSKAEEEVVSNKIVEIEKNIVKKRSKSGIKPGQNESEQSDNDLENAQMEPGGEDESYFHPGGHTETPGPREGQPSHQENGEKEKKPKLAEVSLEKFVPVCVDRKKGVYVFLIVPSVTSEQGSVHVFLSAETQNYDAPIIKASIMGGENIQVKGNVIDNLKFEKQTPLRIKVEMDYYDVCSLEVKTYAITQ
ncbi:MAG: hypothetical protein K6E47_17195 [Lachnospiraceae bacterium]|nr:hypothetical protein [Lachnospiraceae bacterium]